MGIAENAIPFLRERLAQPEQEPVACQYAKDVAMPEYRCAGKCQYAQPEQEPIKESSVTHSHLWIGELWRKEKNT